MHLTRSFNYRESEKGQKVSPQLALGLPDEYRFLYFGVKKGSHEMSQDKIVILA